VGLGVARSTLDAGLRQPLGMNRAALIVLAAAGVLLLVEAASTRRPAILRPPDVPTSRPVESALVLHVQHDGRALRVSWDRNSQTIRHANHSILHIEDGTHNARLELNAAETNAGRLVYWPEAEHVTFRLEAFGPNGVAATATQTPEPPTVAAAVHVDPPAERKPSPFASPKHKTSVQEVRLEPQAEPAAAPRPTGFFARLTSKIPVIRNLRKSGHQSAPSPD
jgi:hypothetical protein